MKVAVKYLALFLVALGAVWSMPPAMQAQAPNKAALVVRHGHNDVRTACVAFDEPEISGYELLRRSGAELQLDVQGMGALVCSIDDTGCPPDDCLCQCRGGGECVYWSYWHHTNGTWTYSQGGSSVYMIEPGAIEGWSWGPGAVNAAIPPPDLTYEDVCEAAPADTSTPTPTATNTQPPLLVTPGSFAPQNTSAAVTPTVAPATSTSTPTARPSATQSQTDMPTAVIQQTEPAAVSTSTPLPTQTMAHTNGSQEEVAGASLAASTPQTTAGEPEPQARTRATTRQIQPAVEGSVTSTPSQVAAAQESGEQQPAAPLLTTQKKARATAEPTAALQVIGAGVVPTFEPEPGESDLDDPGGGLLNQEMAPYLVFVLIVAGLLGLAGFVSLRKRRQS